MKKEELKQMISKILKEQHQIIETDDSILLTTFTQEFDEFIKIYNANVKELMNAAKKTNDIIIQDGKNLPREIVSDFKAILFAFNTIKMKINNIEKITSGTNSQR